MRIGIIGAGNIGGNLARVFTELGHEVRISNSRGPDTLADLAAETGATAVTAGETADGADLIILTIPLKSVPDVAPEALAGAADGTTIIDTGNYYPRERDGRIEAIESGLTETHWAAQQLDPSGRLRWVKAFNGIPAAQILEDRAPSGTPDRRALPVAADDMAAKALVIELLDALGFDAVDAGLLVESWRMQPGTPVYGPPLDAAGVRAALAAASSERAPEFLA